MCRSLCGCTAYRIIRHHTIRWGFGASIGVSVPEQVVGRQPDTLNPDPYTLCLWGLTPRRFPCPGVVQLAKKSNYMLLYATRSEIICHNSGIYFCCHTTPPVAPRTNHSYSSRVELSGSTGMLHPITLSVHIWYNQPQFQVLLFTNLLAWWSVGGYCLPTNMVSQILRYGRTIY